MSNSALDQVTTYGINATDKHMDGFYQFSYKQKLYEVMWEAQRQLSRCDTFVGEENGLLKIFPIINNNVTQR
jgi:hypothetical protein